ISFPAALSLYWVVGNLFMIIQTLVIRTPQVQVDTKEKAGGNKK
ncbi:OxaA precursor, partial [Peribacillus sp. SIMBA_075]